MILDLNFNSILSFGEILWDVFPDKEKIGGAPLNVALHLKKQNIEVYLASAVGNDDKGKGLLKYISSEGLSSNLVQINEILPTSEVIITLDKNKNASYVISEPVAWDCITINDHLIEQMKKSGILVYSSLASRNEITRNTLKELLRHAKLKVFDINLRPPFNDLEIIESLISNADIAKFNDDELLQVKNWYKIEGDEEEVLNVIAKRFDIKTILLTKGIHGAAIYSQGKMYKHQGYKVEAIDTVGAGDAFLAAFLAGYLAKKNLDEILDNACAIGAFVVTQQGANPSYDQNIISNFKMQVREAFA